MEKLRIKELFIMACALHDYRNLTREIIPRSSSRYIKGKGIGYYLCNEASTRELQAECGDPVRQVSNQPPPPPSCNTVDGSEWGRGGVSVGGSQPREGSTWKRAQIEL